MKYVCPTYVRPWVLCMGVVFSRVTRGNGIGQHLEDCRALAELRTVLVIFDVTRRHLDPINQIFWHLRIEPPTKHV